MFIRLAETHLHWNCVSPTAVLTLLDMFTLWCILVGGWTVAVSGIDFTLAEKSHGGRASRDDCDQLPQFAAAGPAALLWFSVSAGTESYSAELTQP